MMISILHKRFLTGGLLMLLLMTVSLGWGQGLENFDNLTVGASYSDGSFVGNNSITWSYIHSRDENNTGGVTAPALMLREESKGSKVTSSAIPNGIGNFSVKLYKGFTGAGSRQVELFINGVSKGTSTSFDDYNEHVFTVNGIDISGDVIIEIKNIQGKQVIVDDITWTGFGGGGNTAPFISNITQNPASNLVTSSDAVSVSADLVDGDGIASAELHWGIASGSLDNTIAMSFDAGNTYIVNSLIPAQADGTTVYYEIEATDANGTPLTNTSAEQSYTVEDPVPFSLPYTNNLRSNDDFIEAGGYGFEFNNAVLTTAGSNGYMKITDGSIISPAIDFSSYTALTVIFDLATWGGNNGQELSVMVSNDNGATYSAALGSFYPTSSSYTTFSQLINLSSLNGTQGRIKLEMTGGTQSLRFRDLEINLGPDGFVYSGGSWSPSDPNIDATDTDDVNVLDGTATFNADIAVNNLTISSGATLNVEKILTLAGDIDNQGNLVFVSTATGNGELAKVLGTSSITGNATVQRYMKNRRSYRMVTSAVTTSTSIHDNWQEGATSSTDNPNEGFGTHITGTVNDQENGFDATNAGLYSMFTVNVGTQQYEAVTNTDVNTLTAGSPYLLFVRGDRSINLGTNDASSETVLRATGSLFTGTSTQDFPAANTNDFVMFGNPYQSAVDMNSVFANSTNVNTAFYYVYDPTLATHGAYVTVSLASPGTSPNQYLQPGQGAQALVTGAGATVVFNEDDKAPGNFTSSNRNPMAGNDMITVQLYTAENFNNGGPVHDSFGIVFAEGNDNALTGADAVKPMNFYENLGINLDGTILSMESREMPQVGEVYAMFSNGYQSTEYVLKVTVDGLEDSVFYLEDQFTGESTMIEMGDNAYSFTIDADEPLSIATDRFSIRTEERLGTNINELSSGIRLYPNPLTSNTFYINAPKLNGEKLSVSISDLTGRNIYEQSLECAANTVTVTMGSNIATGVYLVTVKHNSETQTYRLIRE